MVFDGHSDLFYDVTRRRLAGETHVLERRHRDRLRQGGIEGLVLALWYGRGDGGHTFWEEVPGREEESRRLEIMLSCAQAELAECPWLEVVSTAQEAEAAREAGRLYAFLAIEGMAGLGNRPEEIDRLADWGLRLGMLTWNEENQFAAGAAQDPGKGLTPLGRQALRRMEDRNILPDLSHLNETSFWQALDQIRGPAVASHSNCHALCPHPRNLTDEQLRAIRDTGGVVGLNAYNGFVHQDPDKRTVRTLALHAAHMAEVMGVEHVACGFDFCGFMGGPGNDAIPGLEDWEEVPGFFACLEDLGMNLAEREAIARGNFLRVLGGTAKSKD